MEPFDEAAGWHTVIYLALAGPSGLVLVVFVDSARHFGPQVYGFDLFDVWFVSLSCGLHLGSFLRYLTVGESCGKGYCRRPQAGQASVKRTLSFTLVHIVWGRRT